jgi:heterodisulfide reductase subunit C
MERQNVTLSLPRHIVLKARHVAVERGVSLSKLLSSYLEDLVENGPGYEHAMKEAISMMREGIPMGVDEPTWTREQLHER